MKNFLFKRCALLLLITNLFSIPHEAPLKCNTAMTFADSEATFCSDSRGSTQISSRVYELFFGNKADKRSAEYLIPGGDVFGIKLSESYVSVTGSLDGSAFKTGDKILTLAGVTITGAKDVTRVLESYTGGSISAEILRGGEKMSITVIPKRYDNSYKLGVTLRDTASGIGTVSYIDPETKAFGGLGHGVCDPLTSTPVSIKSGEATGVILGGVTRGEIGKPGELSGILNKKHLGEVAINSECGVFGVLDSFDTQSREALPVGKKSELHRGEAEIISTVKNGKRQSYKIEITEIDKSSTGSKSFKIKVTDPTLITITGGIVRGMSGSPIIQDGKLVGAVTHVLVANPTEGYGIFIENMLSAARDGALPKAA